MGTIDNFIEKRKLAITSAMSYEMYSDHGDYDNDKDTSF